MEDKYLDVPLFVKEDDVDETGKFKGYGSTFGGDPDSYGDIVVSGAFKRTIREGGRNKNGIVMLWGHHSDQVPGVWTSLKEDTHGLLVEGELLLDTQLGKDTHTRLKRGAVKGLSIGYGILKKEIDEENNLRYLKELELWEVSLVSFPANTHATILEVKGIEAIKKAETLRELEDALRESGLSRNISQHLIKVCRSSLRESEKEKEVDPNMVNLLKTIQNVNLNLCVTHEVQNAMF